MANNVLIYFLILKNRETLKGTVDHEMLKLSLISLIFTIFP